MLPIKPDGAGRNMLIVVNADGTVADKGVYQSNTNAKSLAFAWVTDPYNPGRSSRLIRLYRRHPGVYVLDYLCNPGEVFPLKGKLPFWLKLTDEPSMVRYRLHFERTLIGEPYDFGVII